MLEDVNELKSDGFILGGEVIRLMVLIHIGWYSKMLRKLIYAFGLPSEVGIAIYGSGSFHSTRSGSIHRIGVAVKVASVRSILYRQPHCIICPAGSINL